MKFFFGAGGYGGLFAILGAPLRKLVGRIFDTFFQTSQILSKNFSGTTMKNQTITIYVLV
jgi:hypothetical protein